MANTLPLIKKAFLATRNSGSGLFLLTERFEKDGNLFFYLIESQNTKAADKLQKNIHDNLVKSFLESAYFSISNLEQGLHFVNQKKDQESSGNGSDALINAMIGLLDRNALHISMVGNLEGYLLRKGKINSITEGLSDNGTGQFANITSGELNIGDLAVIANKNLFNRLSLDRIRRTLSQFSPREAARDFYQILRRNNSYDCNAILFQAVSPLVEDKDNDALPDFLYLDEIVESKLTKFAKNAKPVITDIFSKIRDLCSSFLVTSKKLLGKASDYGQNKVVPLAKKVSSGSGKSTSGGLTKFSPKISSNIKNSRSKLKIKPYYQSFSGGSSKTVQIFGQIFKWIVAKNNRRYVYAGVIVILISVLYFKISSNNKNRDVVKKQNDAVFALENAEDTFQAANQDIALGKSNGTEELQQALSQAQTASQSDSTREKALALIKDIQDKIDGLSNIKRYYNQNPIFSFKYEPVVTAVSGSKIYAFTDEGKIYMTDARDKDPKLVGSIENSLGKPISATFSDSMSLLFVLTDQSKVWAYDEQSQSGAEVKLDTGSAWEKAQAITSYSTNLYLLDGNEGKIWRHSKSGEVFISGKTYAASKNTDAKEGISMAIDGAIYVLKANGGIAKFSHSITDTSFVLGTIPSPSLPLTMANIVYTDADSQFIFILDKSNNRIIKFAKDGQYSGQYIIDGASVSQILVNSRNLKMWLISGKDVYELDL